MNIALSPQIIPMSWQDYLAKNHDRAIIPWEQYRYSGSGVIEGVGESIQNVEIADALRDRKMPTLLPQRQLLSSIIKVGRL